MGKVIGYVWDMVKPGPWDLLTQSNDAQAPMLYKYDSSGFISPAPNRNITIQDGTVINEYNQRVAIRLQEQESTLNPSLRQIMPNWQPVNYDLGSLAKPTANYSNEGRNYQTPTYNFGRGKGFTDPRLLDSTESYRGLNTYSGVYASKAAENDAFENDWNTALNAYSIKPSYTSFPTDPAAYNGYSDAFGEWTAEAGTDLQALAKVFDRNKDGTFGSRDARFNEFCNCIAANDMQFRKWLNA